MARLNEPPIAPQPSAETIDAVKRRFLRQNRELAKTNSQQSIRIRSLENDCSRLLAENLSLREQVLQLQNSLEAHAARPSFENIDAVKAKLEAKMAELGGLVAELGNMKKADDKPRCRSQLAATRRSPDERQWRSGLGLQEVENGMMPTIVEGKAYPRRTMGADELREMLDDPDSQSPDIGPPPVSRFHNEEPIAFNASRPAEEPQEDAAEDGEPALSVNLETRRKRRESGPKLNIRRVSLFESPPESVDDSAVKTAKAGAKRKFSVQEDEEKPPSKPDVFRFSCRGATASETEASSGEGRPASPERPALASKPVNTDPAVSPKKLRSNVQEKPEKPMSALKARGRPRLNITRTITPPELPMLPIPDPVPTTDIHLDALPPKTPAVEDIFSPPSTESSTSRPESKDTPPPGDLTAANQIGAGRPGRRARPQVSYKEPSLHTKMRRPDAKLVDAIVDRRRSVDTQAPSIKREASEEIGWKPASAIGGRVGEEEGEIGSPLRQKMDRRDTDKAPEAEAEVQVKLSSASKAIEALISETSTAKRKSTTATGVPPKANSDESKDEMASKKDIFDFSDSSPPTHPHPHPYPRITDLAKAARNARRHSTAPSSSSSLSSSSPEERKPQGALASVHKRTGSGTVKSASTSSLARSSSSAANLDRRISALKAGAVEKGLGAGLGKSESSIDLKAKAESGRRGEEGGMGREGRVGTRRRSMML